MHHLGAVSSQNQVHERVDRPASKNNDKSPANTFCSSPALDGDMSCLANQASNGWMNGWYGWGKDGSIEDVYLNIHIYIYICIHKRKNMTKTMPKSKSHEFGASTYDPMTSAKTLRCGDAGGHALELLQRTERCAPNDCSSMGGTQRTTPTATPLPVQNSIITIIINYI